MKEIKNTLTIIIAFIGFTLGAVLVIYYRMIEAVEILKQIAEAGVK